MFVNPKKISKRERLAKQHEELVAGIDSIQLVDIDTPAGPNQIGIPLDDKVIKVLMCSMADVQTVDEIPKDMYEKYAHQAVNIYLRQIISSIHNKYKK